MHRIWILITALAAAPAFAADIASDIRTGANGQDRSDGGYFEAGVVLNYFDGPRLTNFTNNSDNDDKGGVGLAFSGEYRYKGLFAEAAWGSADGLNFGYNLLNFLHNDDEGGISDVVSVDLLASSGPGEGDTDNADIGHLSEDIRNIELEKRKYNFRGSGIRVTGYFGNYIFQYRLLTDDFNDTGVVSTARLGRSWQFGNWNLHGLVSARYASARTNQEAFGITALEATSLFPEYHPDSTVDYSAEVGLTYPINENLVFRTTARLRAPTDEMKASPLLRDADDTGVFFSTSVSYVFGD